MDVHFSSDCHLLLNESSISRPSGKHLSDSTRLDSTRLHQAIIMGSSDQSDLIHSPYSNPTTDQRRKEGLRGTKTQINLIILHNKRIENHSYCLPIATMVARQSFLFLLLAVLPQTSLGYITSHGAVPINRQQQWLRVSCCTN